MAAEIWLEYGRDKQKIEIEQSRLINHIQPEKIEPAQSEEEVILHALNNPVDSPPISRLFGKGDLVTVVVNDLTRLVRSEVFIPMIIRKLLEVGVEEEDITILFATGGHRPQTLEEQLSIVGEIPEGIKLEDHNCHDRDSLMFMGETEAGTPVEVNKKACPPYKTILTGEIGYHLFAGYSGGRKSIVPGVSSFRTIQTNHRLMLKPESHAGSLEGNPLSDDMIEGIGLVRPTMILNVILNDQKQIVRAFAGDYLKAHRAGCRELDRLFGSSVKEQTEIVIGSCGGFPKDINFYQAHKVLENISRLSRDGGVVVLLAACPEGIGSLPFRRGMEDYPDLKSIEERIYNDFEVGMHKALYLRRMLERVTVILVSELSLEDAEIMGLKTAADVSQALEMAEDITGDSSGISVVTDGSITWPLLER